MAIITSYWLYDVIVTTSTILLAAYAYFKHVFKYWEKHGIPVAWTPSFPQGNFKGVRSKKTMGMIAADMYKSGKGQKVIGGYMFNTPIVIARDLDFVKTMLVRDFGSFHDRGIEIDTTREPLAGHLFMMNGQKWRNLRIKLTPTFTSGKMKMMFPTVVEVGKQLVEILDESTKLPEVEIKDILARYNIDIIASTAFGLEANSLKNPKTMFREMGHEFSKPNWKMLLANMLLFMFPKASKYIPMKFIPQHIEDFFIGVVRDSMKYREDNNIHRNDFLQLLLQLKNLGYVKDADHPEQHEDPENIQKFSLEEAAAQAFLFYFAGFETSSSTIQFSLYELAINQELQAKAREEVDEVIKKHGGAITYEAIHEMDLIDRIISETLRKYPVADFLMRQNEEDYRIDSNLTLPAKTMVWVSLSGIHHDEKYYPNPEKFDPDRFSPEEKAARHPYAYLPFGEGPRSCIGNRFALMSMKAGLSLILSKYEVSPSKNTPIPIVFDPKVDIMTPKGLMPLKISKRVK